jgi:serine/threonine protein kinase
MLNVIHREQSISLVLECAETDLRKELTDKYPLTDSVIKNYMKQILLGVYFLHSHRLIHRDIKLNNLLIKNGVVKIADFGLARFFDLMPKEYTGEVVTLWYRAPEILLGYKEYTCSLDMWSVGCIFGELYNKDPLFQGDCSIDQLFKIFQYLLNQNIGDT